MNIYMERNIPPVGVNTNSAIPAVLQAQAYVAESYPLESLIFSWAIIVIIIAVWTYIVQPMLVKVMGTSSTFNDGNLLVTNPTNTLCNTWNDLAGHDHDGCGNTDGFATLVVGPDGRPVHQRFANNARANAVKARMNKSKFLNVRGTGPEVYQTQADVDYWNAEMSAAPASDPSQTADTSSNATTAVATDAASQAAAAAATQAVAAVQSGAVAPAAAGAVASQFAAQNMKHLKNQIHAKSKFFADHARAHGSPMDHALAQIAMGHQ